MAKGKGGGFLIAILIAVISFGVIFFFFTDVSDKYFGVSYKGDAKQEVNSAIEKIDVEKASKIIDNAAEKAKSAVSDLSNLIGTVDGN